LVGHTILFDRLVYMYKLQPRMHERILFS